MNTKSVLVLAITMILMASPLTLLAPKAGADTWTQTTSSDFNEGQSFFTNINDGTLKLSRSLGETWTVEAAGSYDYLGLAVASAGDVNGDGYDDVIVGAYGYDVPESNSNAGRAYVFHGSASGLLAVDDAEDADWSATGTITDANLGRCVAGAGDVNGDGYDDVIVGIPGYSSNKGRVKVFHGSSTGLSSSHDWQTSGSVDDMRVGWAVASAGDVNGDGYDDVMVSAPGWSSNKGRTFVWHGSSTGLDTVSDWYLDGEASSDYFGMSVQSAGDVNGDGYDEAMASAPGYGSAKGRAYLWYGSSTGLSYQSGDNAGNADWTVDGESTGDYLGGYSSLTETSSRSGGLDSAGDVNGDGYDDVIIGAHRNDDGDGNSGKAYAFLGSANGMDSVDDAGDADWSAVGENENDYLGWCVAGAGDVNGDGYDDIMAGSHSNDDGGSQAGKAYLWHGSPSGPVPNPSWSNTGETSDDNFGCSMASAGDVNGDGYGDIIIGAWQNDDGGTSSGKAYLYSYSLSTAFSKEEDWSDQGEAENDEFGYSAASAGDVNGDGYDDVIVGAWKNAGGYMEYGEAYVYFGSATGLSTTPDWADLGESSYDNFGMGVACAGDVNGDGFDDIIVGAYSNSVGGEAYVYFGSSSGPSATPDWSDLGEGSGDRFGWAVGSAGDVNNDGYGDVIIGAYYNDSGGTDAGIAFVYYGSSSGLSDTPDWSEEGENANDGFGLSVASAGDVNADGYDDIVVGAPYMDNGGYLDAGKAFVYFGSPSGVSSGSQWSDFGETGDYFGFSVSSGDVNGDGYSDILVGEPAGFVGGISPGRCYMYSGSASGLPDSPDWVVNGTADSDNFGFSVSSAGDVNGDGYDDVITGAPYNDGSASSAGAAYFYYGSSTGLSTSSDWYDLGEAENDEFGLCVAGGGDVNGDGYDDVIVAAPKNDDGPGNNAGEVYAYYGKDPYVLQGVYDSQTFDISSSSCAADWLSLSWNPIQQPDGTRVRAQVAASHDGTTWNWHGPDGTSTSYFTHAAGQAIHNSDQGKAVKVRFYLESEFGEGGDALGNKMMDRTPSLTDFTVSYMKFTKPSATITSPNGGENLMHGESYPVTWTTTGDLATTTPVALSYSLNGGSTWTDITTATDNDGLYVWTLPSNQDVERALVKVVTTAPDGSTVEDTSDRPFSIDPPPGNPETGDRIISPAAAQELSSGSTVVVEWQLAGEETVSLYTSSNFGQSWEPIVEDILNLGSYHWELPDDMTSEHVVIKVQGAEQEVVSNLFIINEEGAGAQEEAGSEESSGNSVITEGLAALIIGVLVVLVLLIRYNSGKRTTSKSNSSQPNTSQEEKK